MAEGEGKKFDTYHGHLPVFVWLTSPRHENGVIPEICVDSAMIGKKDRIVAKHDILETDIPHGFNSLMRRFPPPEGKKYYAPKPSGSAFSDAAACKFRDTGDNPQ